MPQKKKIVKNVKNNNNKKNDHNNKNYVLISVYDKTGIIKFAKDLTKLGFKLISSGGTAKALEKSRIAVQEVSKLTKYPHMLSGRVKTLHPLIHGGILADRTNEEHVKEMKHYGIKAIDIVVVNLYPFEKVISQPDCTLAKAIENIDVGGPTMVRAAAKNYKNTAIIVDPADYGKIIKELKKNKGTLSINTKAQLAKKAFRHTARYDSIIYSYLTSSNDEQKNEFPSLVNISLEKIQNLRYGENPHQKAAFYRQVGIDDKNQGMSLAKARQLHGKELSFNNIIDLEAAWNCVVYFADSTVAIIKHTNPCGIAQAKTPEEAYKKALSCDPVSAYGSVIAFNRTVNKKTAEEMSSLFVEAIIAPDFEAEALKIFKAKKNIRVIKMGENALINTFKGYDFKRVSGGFLIQEADLKQLAISDIKIVSQNQPSLQEMEDLFFAWGVVKFVKSNAIVVVKNKKAIGIGAGQMSRIDAAEIALKKAGIEAKGAVIASDAFFPFRDCVDLAAKHGISAIIQPGGSIRDQESIDAANEHGISLVFTGFRHFRH